MLRQAQCEMPLLFREHTPIESYTINRWHIYVKREDLYGISPAPPIAKLRGLRPLLAKLYSQGVRLVGCWDTRVSKLGQGLAACSREFAGMKCIVSYPSKKGEGPPGCIREAEELGAEIYPVPGSRLSICYSRASKYVQGQGGTMLPFGLDCPEAVEAVECQAATVPVEILQGGTVVLSCGSGVTLAGLLRGLPRHPRKIVGLSSGRSVRNLRRCLHRYVTTLPPCLELHEAKLPYSLPLDFPCPFPSHPHYDLKAWKFLIENLHIYSSPVLFWNIGA